MYISTQKKLNIWNENQNIIKEDRGSYVSTHSKPKQDGQKSDGSDNEDEEISK